MVCPQSETAVLKGLRALLHSWGEGDRCVELRVWLKAAFESGGEKSLGMRPKPAKRERKPLSPRNVKEFFFCFDRDESRYGLPFSSTFVSAKCQPRCEIPTVSFACCFGHVPPAARGDVSICTCRKRRYHCLLLIAHCGPFLAVKKCVLGICVCGTDPTQMAQFCKASTRLDVAA